MTAASEYACSYNAASCSRVVTFASEGGASQPPVSQQTVLDQLSLAFALPVAFTVHTVIPEIRRKRAARVPDRTPHYCRTVVQRTERDRHFGAQAPRRRRTDFHAGSAGGGVDALPGLRNAAGNGLEWMITSSRFARVRLV